ncbi:MAG TPA: hypothetical protein VL899_13110 [Alphaproteobacteria bacterium]|jgi:hypothetical protein|nr:hypothetical protein [Alphaproteobacteria bacterium]
MNEHTSLAQSWRDAADAWTQAGSDCIGDAEEARRARRRRDLEIARMMAMDMMALLAQGAAGRLMGDAQAIVDKINPYSAMTQMMQAVQRCIHQEEQLDQTVEERAKRLAAEAEAREAERLAAEARAKAAAERAAQPDTGPSVHDRKKLIRRAMGMAARDMDATMSRLERELELDELFLEFDDYGSFSGDAVEITMRLCCDLAEQLGCIDPIEPGGLTDLPKDATPEERVAALRELAQSYLDRAAGKPPDVPAEPAAEPEPAESG